MFEEIVWGRKSRSLTQGILKVSSSINYFSMCKVFSKKQLTTFFQSVKVFFLKILASMPGIAIVKGVLVAIIIS